MSGLTGYLTANGTDLSYIFHPINTIISETTSNTYSGTNTFSGTTFFSQIQLSCGTISSTSYTLPTPPLNFYHITTSTATTITFPTPVDADKGSFIIFKHTAAGNITISCSTINIVGYQVTGASTSSTMTSAKVVMVACNGSAWWIYYVA